MARNYGNLGKRRGGSAAWQWSLLGIILSSFCWLLAIFGLLASGIFNLDPGSAGPPVTQVVAVITATDDPNQPTPEPVVITQIITTTPEPTPDAPIVDFVLPSPTPTPDTAAEEAAATEETTAPQTAGTTQTDVSGLSTAPRPAVVIPEPLRNIVTSLVTISGGTFQMGTTVEEVINAVNACRDRDEGNCQVSYGEDSQPPFSVLLDTFQMELTEVTFGQYVAFLNWMGPSSHRNGCFGFPCVETKNENPDTAVIIFDSANYDVAPISLNYPVYGVTWYGARAYCEAIGRRLPTEAEWERAARGDTGFVYPWGNEWSDTLARTGRPRGQAPGPLPVGSFPIGASPYGVLDMAGNVAEWVADWYSETYYRQQASLPQPILSPAGPPTGVFKVVRGGSWPDVPFFARAVHRQSQEPEAQTVWIGFRCAADIDESAEGFPPAGGVDPASLGTGFEDEPLDAQPLIAPPPEAAAGDDSQP